MNARKASKRPPPGRSFQIHTQQRTTCCLWFVTERRGRRHVEVLRDLAPTIEAAALAANRAINTYFRSPP